MTAKKYSTRFATIKRYYDRGIWSKEMIAKAVKLGHITSSEYEEICGEPYPAESEQ